MVKKVIKNLDSSKVSGQDFLTAIWLLHRLFSRGQPH